MGEIVIPFQSIEGFVIDFFGARIWPYDLQHANLQQLLIPFCESTPKTNKYNPSSETQETQRKKRCLY